MPWYKFDNNQLIFFSLNIGSLLFNGDVNLFTLSNQLRVDIFKTLDDMATWENDGSYLNKDSFEHTIVY